MTIREYIFFFPIYVYIYTSITSLLKSFYLYAGEHNYIHTAVKGSDTSLHLSALTY